jgi:hypothetical protein
MGGSGDGGLGVVHRGYARYALGILQELHQCLQGASSATSTVNEAVGLGEGEDGPRLSEA